MGHIKRISGACSGKAKRNESEQNKCSHHYAKIDRECPFTPYKRMEPVALEHISTKIAGTVSPSVAGVVDATTESEAITAFLAKVEKRRRWQNERLEPDRRARFGQFFTPSPAADLIVNMVTLPEEGILRVLDPGAGIGTLTAALVARIIRERPRLCVSVYAIEIDPVLIPHLERTLTECGAVAAGHGVNLTTRVISEDFVDFALGWTRPLFEQFDVVIMNPPYQKLPALSASRRALAGLGVDSPNLYSSFLATGCLALVPGGQLVAITPRSFANGPYFEAFRKFLLSQVRLTHIHVFESRSSVFSDNGVLQENVVFAATRWTQSGNVRLSVSRGHLDQADLRTVDYEEIVRPQDSHQFINIPINSTDAALGSRGSIYDFAVHLEGDRARCFYREGGGLPGARTPAGPASQGLRATDLSRQSSRRQGELAEGHS
ncbi:MAG: Eco57I restriction-modification methylase domain-containing protein [Chloroflexota bacterium]|nr:Eco57I restriction-modification methylase domain-containing protein [Chloroflexota bacterium]